MPVTGLGSVLSATNGKAAWQCHEGLALSYNQVTVHVTAARACPCSKMPWTGLTKTPHLLPHRGQGRLHLYKARRSGSTLKKKITCFALKSHLWCTREKAGLYVNQNLEVTSFRRAIQAFRLGWIPRGLSAKLQLKAGSPCYSSICPGSSWKPPATEPTQPAWWLLTLPACLHGQQIVLYNQSDINWVYKALISAVVSHPTAPSPPSLPCPYSWSQPGCAPQPPLSSSRCS